MFWITKQPGANVIEAAQRIKARCRTRLKRRSRRRSRPIFDRNRTTDHPASVNDVEFTLALTIALVVMVIFLFLRNVLGDAHPQRHRAAGAARHRRG